VRPALATLLIRLSWAIEMAAYNVNADAAYDTSLRLEKDDPRDHHAVARDFGVEVAA
jgi:hypothetical protein